MYDSNEVQILETPEMLFRYAANVFMRIVNSTLQSKPVCTVVLSGGSTPGKLYTLLADEKQQYRDHIQWDKLHFFWGDERDVPPDNPDNNYRMAYETLLSRIPVPGSNIHRIITEKNTPDQAAKSYELHIRHFFGFHDQHLPVFDLVFLGLGADGHTASLFPETDVLTEKNMLVAAPWIEKLGNYRITMTIPLINNASFVIFLVSGNEKSSIIKHVLHDRHTSLYPAQLIAPVSGNLFWFLDSNAAADLQ